MERNEGHTLTFAFAMQHDGILRVPRRGKLSRHESSLERSTPMA